MARSSYIIICDSQIQTLAAESVADRIAAISNGATRLVQHVESTYPGLTQADVQAISDLQHFFMDNIHTMKKVDAEIKIAEMVQLMRDLEKKFE